MRIHAAPTNGPVGNDGDRYPLHPENRSTGAFFTAHSCEQKSFLHVMSSFQSPSWFQSTRMLRYAPTCTPTSHTRALYGTVMSVQTAAEIGATSAASASP